MSVSVRTRMLPDICPIACNVTWNWMFPRKKLKCSHFSKPASAQFQVKLKTLFQRRICFVLKFLLWCSVVSGLPDKLTWFNSAGFSWNFCSVDEPFRSALRTDLQWKPIIDARVKSSRHKTTADKTTHWGWLRNNHVNIKHETSRFLCCSDEPLVVGKESV